MIDIDSIKETVKVYSAVEETAELHSLSDSIEKANLIHNQIRITPAGSEVHMLWMGIDKVCHGFRMGLIETYDPKKPLPRLVTAMDKIHEHKEMLDKSLGYYDSNKLISCRVIENEYGNVVQVDQLERLDPNWLEEKDGHLFLKVREVNRFAAYDNTSQGGTFEIIGPDYKRTRIKK